MAVVGSSLGGYYATWLAEQLGCKAVLLNPAVDAARDLAPTSASRPLARPGRALLLRAPATWTNCARCSAPARCPRPSATTCRIAKGDEVLDWREMTARYPGATLRLLDGGDHALSDFAQHVDAVLAFPRSAPDVPGAIRARRPAPPGRENRDNTAHACIV
jgi:predicted esterase YcpF (UPF0227 family)